MKKLILFGALMLSACAQNMTVDANASTQTRMKTCMLSEANTRFQAGTLFTQSVKVTADDIVNTCLKKLALQAAGIDEESQSTAQSIIQNLKNLSGK